MVLSRTLWNMQKKGLIKIYGTELVAKAKKVLEKTEDEDLKKIMKHYMEKEHQKGKFHYPITKDLNKKASMVKIDENGIVVATLLRKKRENLNNKKWANY